MSLPYEIRGNTGQPPVFFFHGFLGRRQDWLGIAEQLEKGFCCVMVDLPGHGENLMGPLDKEVSFAEISNALAELVNALGYEKVNVIGYSLGARAALNFALDHPEHVRRLVLESGSPGIENEGERANRHEQDKARAEKIRQLGLSAFLESWYQAPLFSSLQAEEHKDLLAHLLAMRSTNDIDWIAKIIEELSPGNQPSRWDDLSMFSCPTLLVAGGLDEKYCEIVKRMGKLIPSSEMAIVDGAGHTVHAERQEAFVRIAREFLGQPRD